MYGYEEVETPALDALRADSLLVERAYAHLPLTLPSHATIFTGQLPIEHGLRDNLGYKVPDDLPTLASILGDAGWATGGAVSAYVLRKATGIARGFDHYDDVIQVRSGVELGGLQRGGPDTLAALIRWLDEPRTEPPFLFLHIYEPHSPYQAPEPFGSRYEDPYDGEVAAADAVIGALSDALRSRGLYEDALIVLVSDHGEGLMDHGEMEHEVLIYRETLQVPFLVKLPSNERGGETIPIPAQLADVLPTVLDVLGIEAPAELSGKSVLQLTEGDRTRQIFSESVYPRIHFGWSELASLIEDQYHFIDGPDPELYDLIRDPEETQNILQRERAVSRRLRTALEKIDRTLQPPAEVDPAVRESLLSLGYVGGSRGATATGADPKSRIHVLEDLGAASRLYVAGRYAEAASAYRSVLREEPGMVYAREQLAKALRRTGRTDEALGELRQALDESGGAPHIALSLAELYLSLGELDEAQAHAEMARRQNEAALDLLAQVALRRNDLQTARAVLDEALAARGTRVEPLITLAELLVREGNHAAAVDAAARARREFGDRQDVEVLRGLAYQEGLALANLGRTGEAERAFRNEIALSPNEIAPYTRLAGVLALSGRGEEAIATLRQLVETNPVPMAYREAAAALAALGNPGAGEALLDSARRRWPGAPELDSR